MFLNVIDFKGVRAVEDFSVGTTILRCAIWQFF